MIVINYISIISDSEFQRVTTDWPLAGFLLYGARLLAVCYCRFNNSQNILQFWATIALMASVTAKWMTWQTHHILFQPNSLAAFSILAALSVVIYFILSRLILAFAISPKMQSRMYSPVLLYNCRMIAKVIPCNWCDLSIKCIVATRIFIPIFVIVTPSMVYARNSDLFSTSVIIFWVSS